MLNEWMNEQISTYCLRPSLDSSVQQSPMTAAHLPALKWLLYGLAQQASYLPLKATEPTRLWAPWRPAGTVSVYFTSVTLVPSILDPTCDSINICWMNDFPSLEPSVPECEMVPQILFPLSSTGTECELGSQLPQTEISQLSLQLKVTLWLSGVWVDTMGPSNSK